jgi:hypothetical protein
MSPWVRTYQALANSHANALKAVGHTVEKADAVRQAGPNLGNGEERERRNECAEAPFRLILPPRECKARCEKSIDPDGLGLLDQSTAVPVKRSRSAAARSTSPSPGGKAAKMVEAALQGDLRDGCPWSCTQKLVTRPIEPDSAQKFNWRLVNMAPEMLFQRATRDVARGR